MEEVGVVLDFLDERAEELSKLYEGGMQPTPCIVEEGTPESLSAMFGIPLTQV